MKRRCLTVAILAVITASVHAQGAAPGANRDEKIAHIERTTTPPVIDGVLDEAVWQQGTLIDNLHQIIPVEYAPPSEKTEIRLLYDDDFLYVGAKMYIDPKLITHNVLRRNGSITQDDYLSVSFDTFNNQRGGYFFATNPNGVRMDGLYRNVSEFFSDWDSIFYLKTNIVEDGWIAEYAIPFKSISFDPASDTWGMNFSRKIQGRAEQMTWVSNDRRFDPSSAGKMTGFHDLKQGMGLDVMPSITSNTARLYAPGTTKNNIEPSLDLFYKVTSSLNASLTINTDFSATEVDDRQVNLTRFGLFFPEKREFFLRDADIFEFGRIEQNGQPFFSRRIGLSRSGTALDLAGGVKLSGRVGDWEVGALSIRQAASPGLDASTLSVMRVKTGVLSESTIGAIFTQGNPGSNLSNSLAGADFLYRNSHLARGRLLEVATWYQQSTTEGINNDDSAYGVSVEMPASVGIKGGASARRYEANFNPALGFANRVGVDQYTGKLGNTWRPKSQRWQTYDVRLEAERFNDMNGHLQSQILSVTPLEVVTTKGDSLVMRMENDKEVLVAPFPIAKGVVIPVGSYDFSKAGVELRTAQYRKLSGRLGYIDGNFYGGDQHKYTGQLTWVPTPQIRATTGVNLTFIDLPQGSFTTRVLTAGLDYVFSNSLSLVNLIQYDNVSETAGLNMRVNWIPAEGQEFFFVINHMMQDYDLDDRFRSAASDMTLKFSYTFRY